jgi:hypothetical protein
MVLIQTERQNVYTIPLPTSPLKRRRSKSLPDFPGAAMQAQYKMRVEHEQRKQS